MSLLSKFKKFLGKHSDELGDLVTVLRIVVPALAIDTQDKARALNILDRLAKASSNISKAASEMSEEDAVPLEEKTILSAVGKKLPDILGKLLKNESHK